MNHEREGRKHEFGPSRDAAAQRADIAAGRERLADLLGDRVDPIFTPPWNRCTADTGRCLAELGFEVLSARRARRRSTSRASRAAVSVDWFAHRHGERLSPAELGARIAEAIGTGRPLGVMFHHAVMDAGEMRRAAELLSAIAGHEGARPMSMMEVAGGVGQPARPESPEPEPLEPEPNRWSPEPDPLESGVGVGTGSDAAARATPARSTAGRTASRRMDPLDPLPDEPLPEEPDPLDPDEPLPDEPLPDEPDPLDPLPDEPLPTSRTRSTRSRTSHSRELVTCRTTHSRNRVPTTRFRRSPSARTAPRRVTPTGSAPRHALPGSLPDEPEEPFPDDPRSLLAAGPRRAAPAAPHRSATAARAPTHRRPSAPASAPPSRRRAAAARRRAGPPPPHRRRRRPRPRRPPRPWPASRRPRPARHPAAAAAAAESASARRRRRGPSAARDARAGGSSRRSRPRSVAIRSWLSPSSAWRTITWRCFGGKAETAPTTRRSRSRRCTTSSGRSTPSSPSGSGSSAACGSRATFSDALCATRYSHGFSATGVRAVSPESAA